jgi:diaminopimelate decarboxylase
LLLLETGRALVDEAGFLITSVLSVQTSADGGRALIVDAGVNLLYTANWYRMNIDPAQEVSGPMSKTIVYGPLCMNIDVLRDDAPLPAVNAGQQLVIHPVGAYNITQSMQFITYRPRVVMIGADGSVDIIRQRETLESVEALEEVPDRLEAPPAESS